MSDATGVSASYCSKQWASGERPSRPRADGQPCLPVSSGEKGSQCGKMQQMRGERFREQEGAEKSCDNNSWRKLMLGIEIKLKSAKIDARESENQA